MYGIDDIRTAVGYFHLGKVFHELNRDDIAEPMFDMVIHRASNDRCLKLGRHTARVHGRERVQFWTPVFTGRICTHWCQQGLVRGGGPKRIRENFCRT